MLHWTKQCQTPVPDHLMWKKKWLWKKLIEYNQWIKYIFSVRTVPLGHLWELVVIKTRDCCRHLIGMEKHILQMYTAVPHNKELSCILQDFHTGPGKLIQMKNQNIQKKPKQPVNSFWTFVLCINTKFFFLNIFHIEWIIQGYNYFENCGNIILC